MTTEPENVTEDAEGTAGRDRVAKEMGLEPDVTPGDEVADPDDEDADGDLLAGEPANGEIDDGPLLDSTASLRQSWQRIQAEFVDDPQASVREAAEIVSELTETVVSTIQRREQRIRSSWEGNGSGVPGTGNTDTEQLRTTFRRYRALFDQLTEL
jgi:hypothetical protein